jgi:hypothetical protein
VETGISSKEENLDGTSDSENLIINVSKDVSISNVESIDSLSYHSGYRPKE